MHTQTAFPSHYHLDEIYRFGSIPALVSTAQLLAGIIPAELIAYEAAAANAKYTNTKQFPARPNSEGLFQCDNRNHQRIFRSVTR